MPDTRDLSFDLPTEIKKITKGFRWKDCTFGYSGTSVFKLTRKQETLFLKINNTNSDFNLEREKTILEWIQDRLPVPKVVFFGINNNIEFLLLSEVKGKNSHTFKSEVDKSRNIEILAEGLKKIHSIKPNDCPINNNPDVLIEMAQNRMKNRSIDQNQFDERWQSKSPEMLFEEIISIKPQKYDLVFTHGDYCLPNVIINNAQLSGFIDWPYGGINDRYFDFAAVAWSIGYNYGEEWIPLFFEKYGLDDVDWDRIKFFQMLNEFFQQ